MFEIKNNNYMKKPFVLRKVIYADSAEQAIRLDKNTDVTSVFIDPDWEEKHKDDNII